MRSSAWAWVGDKDIAECIRKPLAVFRRADLGPQRFDPEPTAVAEARKQGFVPLRELTGVADDLGVLWPSEHSLWVEQLGPAFGEDEDDEVLDRLLVRSPWPSLSVPQTLKALWSWVEQAAPPTPRPPFAEAPFILEFFRLSEPDALAFATGHERWFSNFRNVRIARSCRCLGASTACSSAIS